MWGVDPVEPGSGSAVSGVDPGQDVLGGRPVGRRGVEPVVEPFAPGGFGQSPAGEEPIRRGCCNGGAGGVTPHGRGHRARADPPFR
jgi:hypothetical protein